MVRSDPMRRRAACRARALTSRQWPAANAIPLSESSVRDNGLRPTPFLYPSQVFDSAIRVNHPSQVSESFFMFRLPARMSPRRDDSGQGPGARAAGSTAATGGPVVPSPSQFESVCGPALSQSTIRVNLNLCVVRRRGLGLPPRPGLPAAAARAVLCGARARMRGHDRSPSQLESVCGRALS